VSDLHQRDSFEIDVVQESIIVTSIFCDIPLSYQEDSGTVSYLRSEVYISNNIYEELHILYSSPNIIRQIKSRRIRWAGHVAHMGEECVQGFDGKARRKETTWKTKA
jgi:hypothetical protein